MTTILDPMTRTGAAGLVRNIGLAVAGTILIAIFAQIKVPMWPVPMTLQTLAVLLIGLTYGGRLATATLVLYLAEGALGLPVFANGGGIAQIAGPTGGYLIGFLFAASFLGFASDRGMTRNVPMLAGALTLATALIYVPGVLWLAGFIGAQKALMVGLVPFLLGDLVKAIIAAMIAPTARKLMH